MNKMPGCVPAFYVSILLQFNFLLIAFQALFYAQILWPYVKIYISMQRINIIFTCEEKTPLFSK